MKKHYEESLYLSYDGVAIALQAKHINDGIYRAENHSEIIEIDLRDPENRRADWSRLYYGEKAYLRDTTGLAWAVYTDVNDIFD